MAQTTQYEHQQFYNPDTKPATNLSVETEDPIEEKHRLTKKQKMVMGTIGTAIALVAGGFGIGSRFGSKSETPKVFPAVETGKAAEAQIPTEAKAFVDEYGSQFSDAVSTYYAEKAYEARGHKSVMMSDKFISAYDKGAEEKEKSNLGFERFMLPKKEALDRTASLEIFNNYYSKELSLYMNCIARNPSAEAQAITDHEFEVYCSWAGSTNNIPEMTVDDSNVNSLLETGKSIVEKYGSTSNYTVEKSSIDSGDTNSTYFNPNDTIAIIAVDKNNKPTTVQDLVNLQVSVDTYTKQQVIKTTETLKNFQPIYMRIPDPGYDFTYISIGQVPIQ